MGVMTSHIALAQIFYICHANLKLIDIYEDFSLNSSTDSVAQSDSFQVYKGILWKQRFHTIEHENVVQ